MDFMVKMVPSFFNIQSCFEQGFKKTFNSILTHTQGWFCNGFQSWRWNAPWGCQDNFSMNCMGRRVERYVVFLRVSESKQDVILSQHMSCREGVVSHTRCKQFVRTRSIFETPPKTYIQPSWKHKGEKIRKKFVLMQVFLIIHPKTIFLHLSSFQVKTS